MAQVVVVLDWQRSPNQHCLRTMIDLGVNNDGLEGSRRDRLLQKEGVHVVYGFVLVEWYWNGRETPSQIR